MNASTWIDIWKCQGWLSQSQDTQHLYDSLLSSLAKALANPQSLHNESPGMLKPHQRHDKLLKVFLCNLKNICIQEKCFIFILPYQSDSFFWSDDFYLATRNKMLFQFAQIWICWTIINQNYLSSKSILKPSAFWTYKLYLEIPYLRSLSWDLLITEYTVLSKVDQASLWNVIITVKRKIKILKKMFYSNTRSVRKLLQFESLKKAKAVPWIWQISICAQTFNFKFAEI